MYIKINISSQRPNRLKGILVISKLHKSLSSLSHLGKTYLTYLPQKVPFASEIYRRQLVQSK